MAFKSHLINTCLMLSSLVFIIGFLEVVLRITGVAPPQLMRYAEKKGLSFIPGASGVFTKEGRSQVRINSSGQRDVEFKEPTMGETGIAFIGDSFVAALQVDLEHSFVKKVEHLLTATCKKARAFNFGVPGSGTVQQAQLLPDVLAYHPQFVVLAFYPGNDLINNSKELSGLELRPHFDLVSEQFDLSFEQSPSFQYYNSGHYRAGQKIAGYSHLGRLLLKAADGFFLDRENRPSGQNLAQKCAASYQTKTLQPGVFGEKEALYKPPSGRVWSEAWEITERLILRMHGQARAAGSKFLLVSLSAPLQVHPDQDFTKCMLRELDIPDLFYPGRRLQAFAQKAGIESLDVVPELSRQARASGLYFHGFGDRAGTGHYNQAGHAAVARLIGARLCLMAK